MHSGKTSPIGKYTDSFGFRFSPFASTDDRSPPETLAHSAGDHRTGITHPGCLTGRHQRPARKIRQIAIVPRGTTNRSDRSILHRKKISYYYKLQTRILPTRLRHTHAFFSERFRNYVPRGTKEKPAYESGLLFSCTFRRGITLRSYTNYAYPRHDRTEYLANGYRVRG